MASSIKYTGRWVPIGQFIQNSGYIIPIGSVPHVIVDNSQEAPRLKVFCVDQQVRFVNINQYLVLEDESPETAVSRFNVSTTPVGTVVE